MSDPSPRSPWDFKGDTPIPNPGLTQRSASVTVWRYLMFIVLFFTILAVTHYGFDAFWLWSANGGFDNLVWRIRYHGDVNVKYGEGRWRDPQRCDTLVGSKTPYSQRCRAPPQKPATPPTGCKAASPNAMIHIGRHGTRALGEKDRRKVSGLNSIQAKCAAVGASCPDWVARWAPPAEGGEGWRKQLLKTGQYEQHALGVRTRLLYRSIFPLMAIDPRKHVFCSSNSTRTIESGRSFLRGIAGKDLWDQWSSPPMPFDRDYILRFGNACPAYHQRETADRAHIRWEKQASKAFMDRVFTEISQGIRKRHGITVTQKDLKNLWKGCMEDTISISTTASSMATHDRRLLAPLPATPTWGTVPEGDGWCGFLSHDDRVKLEYSLDLKQHRKVGHGNPMKRITVKPLLHRILTEVTFMATAAAKGKGAFWFGHTETIIPLLVALGMYKDLGDLDARRDTKEIMNRKFRMTKIGPFAQNLEFLVYNCEGGSYVRLVHNEQEIALPICGMRTWCPLALFRKAVARVLGDVRDYIRGCQLNKDQTDAFEEALLQYPCRLPREEEVP